MAANMKCKLKLICSISVHNTVRHIYTGVYLQNGYMNSKTMRKIMNKANRKKDSKWYAPIYEQSSVFNNSVGGRPVKAKRKFSEGMQRRAKYVSEVLYEDITQIIGNGELGVTATVTQVKVIPDMAHMNIYWECSGDRERDEQTQIALNEKARLLRHSLIEAQTLGNVPRPIFVKDLSVARQRQVDEILHKISLENSAEVDDSELDSKTHNASELTSESDSDVSSEQNFTVTANEEKETIDLDGDKHLDNDDGSDFRQDVYGLQHDVLMKKVISAKESTIQRPSIVSRKESEADNLRNFSLKIKTKSLNAKKPLSKKKLLRQFELEDAYEYINDRDASHNDELWHDTGNDEEIDNDEEYSGNYSAIDEYIEKYSKEK